MLSKTVGDEIRKRRKALGLSRENLGGCHAKVIARIESGKSNPTLATLELIAKQLGCKVADLLDRESAPPAPASPRLSTREKRILDATDSIHGEELRLLLKLAAYLRRKELG